MYCPQRNYISLRMRSDLLHFSSAKKANKEYYKFISIRIEIHSYLCIQKYSQLRLVNTFVVLLSKHAATMNIALNGGPIVALVEILLSR